MLKEIIAHRGFWLQPEEKNSVIAFERALKNGFGIETDIRDFNSKLVISHDIPRGPSLLSISDFLDLYKSIGHYGTLALNVKSDGLFDELLRSLKEYEIKNYFCFDMSIPDMLGYVRNKIRVYTRFSDVEPVPCLLTQADGIWLDSFEKEDWMIDCPFLNQDSAVDALCVVSPELHKREHLEFWHNLRKKHLNSVMLCTDFPIQARDFFYEKN